MQLTQFNFNEKTKIDFQKNRWRMKKCLCITVKKRVRNDELLKKCVSIKSTDSWYCWKMFSIYSNQLNIKKKCIYNHYVKYDRFHKRVEIDRFD